MLLNFFWLFLINKTRFLTLIFNEHLSRYVIVNVSSSFWVSKAPHSYSDTLSGSRVEFVVLFFTASRKVSLLVVFVQTQCGQLEPIHKFIYRLTDKFFHNCSTHSNPLVCQIGNYTLSDLHAQCRKYIHKWTKHLLL
jgi:hypothetical protein